MLAHVTWALAREWVLSIQIAKTSYMSACLGHYGISSWLQNHFMCTKINELCVHIACWVIELFILISFIFSQLYSPPLTATTSRPIDVASATEPKEISYQDETKTLEAVEQSQVLQVEAGVPSVSATAPIVEGQHIHVNTSSVALTSKEGTGRTKHSTRTKGKHRTATHKRQHSELRLVCAKLCYSYWLVVEELWQ